MVSNGWRTLFLSLMLLSSLHCRMAGAGVGPTATAGDGAAEGDSAAIAAGQATAEAKQPAPSVTVTALPSATATPAPSATPLPTATMAATATPAPTPTALPHPLYCAQPPDDYARVAVGIHTLNARTLAMLHAAQQIYEGPGDIMRITQGSYRDVVEASFGTHAGGGAVDISIRDPRNESIFLREEAGPMVMALRYAGFAAWFRDVGDLGENSPAHIHAIAVGDGQLSAAAQEQVSGAGGYLAGMDGLIAPYGPNADRHGGPVICPWMALE